MEIKFRLKEFGGPEEGTAEDAVKCLAELNAKLAASEKRVVELQRIEGGKGEVIVLSNEVLELPSTADAKTQVARVHQLAGQAADYKKKYEEALKRLSESASATRKLKEIERNTAIDKAIADIKINAVERGRLEKLFDLSPTLFYEELEQRKAQIHLTQEMGIANAFDAPVDVFAEIAGRVQEKKAKDKDLTDGKAQELVFAEDPKLHDRYVAARRGEKGGVR